MVIRGNVTFFEKELRDHKSGDKLVPASSSPVTLKTPVKPLTPRLSRQASVRRNHSITATVTIAGPAYSSIPAARFTASGLPSAMAQADTKKPLDNSSDPATQEFHGDVKVSTSLPSKPTLEKCAELPVLDVDGKTVPFKSLYWPDANESKKVMIIFIRHFFCGNCQEYLRTLATAIPPTSLPSDTSIRIVGCGSHTLIPSYIEQTKCPYPIFADPSKKLYSLLGMARTLNLGTKDPDYIQHTLVSGMVKSIAQGLRRIASGDALQAGDIRQVGGEFLFEVAGGDARVTNSKSGNGPITRLEVAWCHRMKNTRDHAELPELRTVLGLDKAEGEERRRRSESSWRNSGLARSLSNKRQSLSWSRTRRRSRSAEQKLSHDPKQIDTVNEEAKYEDGPTPNGHKPAAGGEE